MVTLRSFVDADEQQRYATEFIASGGQMKVSGTDRKYSLKYEQIAHHEIVHRASSAEMLGLVNELLSGGPGGKITLTPPDVQVGYSITSKRGDFVSFHFDHLCVLNVLVPVVLPASVAEEPATLSLWPNVLPFGGTTRYPVRSKLCLLAGRTAAVHGLPLRTYEYRAGDALLFYGARSLHGVFKRNTDGLRAVASINYRFPNLEELARS